MHTNTYERHLIVPLVNSTFTHVEAKEDVSYDSLLGILDHWIASSVEWNRLERFATLGIDEIALLKDHGDFVAVISALSESEELHVLTVLPDQLKATVLT